MLDMERRSIISNDLYSWLDIFALFAHHYVSEVFLLGFSTMKSSIPSKPNETCFGRKLVRDWIERYFEKMDLAI